MVHIVCVCVCVLFFFRQSEVIAQDSRLMKHILVVRKGSMEIWKRLDPSGFVPKLNKTELDRIKNEKSLFDFLFCFKNHRSTKDFRRI